MNEVEMKRLCLIVMISLLCSSCAPVLNPELMRRGIRDLPPSVVRDNADRYRGKLFILGGIIVDTQTKAEGTLIEAIYLPVDSYGYLSAETPVDGRYLALYEGFLDPLIFRKDREITIAGEFIENRRGKVGEIDYLYPLFKIKEIYLWEERRYYLIPPFPWWYEPWYDPWWHRHWWRYH